MKTIPTRRSQAFSTVELMIVVAIIGTLATLAIPSFARANMESKLSRTKNDLRVLFDVFNLYAIEYGNYPSAGGGGNYYTEAQAAPAPLAEFLEESRGESKTPMGGHYFYYYVNVFDDTISSHRFIPMLYIDNWNYGFFGWPSVPLAPTEWFQSLDDDLDDGDLTTGRFQMRNAVQAIYTLDDSAW